MFRARSDRLQKVFPAGLGVAGEVGPVYNFERSTIENRIQAIDKDLAFPLWSVDVMDFDPEARERTFKVKIAAKVQPVPPELASGFPVRPVFLEGLTITPYIKDMGNGRQRIAYSLKATGLSAPRLPTTSRAAPSWPWDASCSRAWPPSPRRPSSSWRKPPRRAEPARRDSAGPKPAPSPSATSP